MFSSLKRRILTIVIFFTALNISAQEGWFWQYPKPQGNSLNDIYIFNNDIAIAVGEMGTVIKTRDGGETWDVRHHATGTSNSLKSVWFIDDHSGWIVDNQSAFKTVDGGDHWSAIYNGTECMPSNVHFLDENTGFVFGRTKEQGYSYGICCKTVNGGKSWSCSRFPSMDLHEFNSCFFTGKDTGWVVGSGFGPNEIYKTTDCGETWRQQHITPEVYGCRKIQFINSKTGFMVAEFGAFLKTVNGGDTWQYQNLFEKYQKDKYQFFYSVYFVDSLHGWIVGGDHDGYILRTTDGGENWIEEDIDIPSPLYEVSFSDSLHGWVVGQFGLIYRTTDGGENWVSQRERQTCWLTSISFADSQNGWAVGEGGTILHTTDGGMNWTTQVSNTSGWLYDVHFIDENIGWVAGKIKNDVGIMGTNNGGNTWNPQETSPSGLFSISFLNSEIGWAVGYHGFILKTTDSGSHWMPQDSKTSKSLYCVHFINDNIGWACGINGSIIKTKNGGIEWIYQNIDSTLWFRSIYFIDDKKGWVVGDYDNDMNVFKTEDGGETWTSIDIGSNKNLYSVYFVDKNTGWIAEGSRYILKTTDGGETWNVQRNTPSKGFNSLYFVDSNTGWAVGYGIFKTTTGGDASVDNSHHSSAIPQRMRLYQNYPNPFNPSTTIRYFISKPSFVSLKIYDLLGREVETLTKSYRPPGMYEIYWMGENIPSGLYLYQLQAGNFYETRKFILTK